jgi:uncharacterized protein YndB with AHSA1/START domain
MLESRGATVIGRPVEDVFDYLADMRNEPQWLIGASDVRLESDEPIGGGSRFTGTYARAGEVRCTIIQFDRPHRLTIKGDAGGMSFEDEITLGSADGTTQLTAVMRTQPKRLFKLVAPLMGRVIDKQFQGNWDRLRTVLESQKDA